MMELKQKLKFRVSDVIQKYRALIKKDPTCKINLSMKGNTEVLLKE